MVANIAVLIHDNHMGFNHMDAYDSCMLGCSYFASPDYLVVKAWITATVLFPSFINLIDNKISVSGSWVLGSRYSVSVYCGHGFLTS